MAVGAGWGHKDSNDSVATLTACYGSVSVFTSTRNRLSGISTDQLLQRAEGENTEDFTDFETVGY